MPRSAPIRRRFRRNKTKKRTKRVPSNGTSKRNPFSALVVTGVRTIISALPGSAFLLPVVDLLFTSLGFSTKDGEYLTSTKLFESKEVAFNGVTGVTPLHYVNIMARTSACARDVEKGPNVWANTPYTDAKLISLTISASPDSIQGKRSGLWTIAFFPFRNVNDESEMGKGYRPLSVGELQAMAGSVTGPADKPLMLTFKPTPADGFIYQYNNMSKAFGLLAVAYEEDVRTSYHEITADDWAPNITIRGTISLRQPSLRRGGATGFEDKTDKTIVTTPRASILFKELQVANGKSYRRIDYAGDDFKCTKGDGTCSIKGKLSQTMVKESELSLDDLSME